MLILRWDIFIWPNFDIAKLIIIMAGSIRHTIFKKNSRRANKKDKQITSVNPEKPDEKDEF